MREEKQLSKWYKEKKRSYSMDYKPSLIGKSDKPPSGMFVTNHFNKMKENTRYIQPSIMQHKITFIGEFYHPNLILHSTKFKYVGWSSTKHLM